jgi:hypothetical protein
VRRRLNPVLLCTSDCFGIGGPGIKSRIYRSDPGAWTFVRVMPEAIVLVRGRARLDCFGQLGTDWRSHAYCGPFSGRTGAQLKSWATVSV